MNNVYSVGQVNRYVKNMFTQDYFLQNIYVKGEVSNCKYHTSGHIYFTLKDGGAQIAAVMFAGLAYSSEALRCSVSAAAICRCRSEKS